MAIQGVNMSPSPQSSRNPFVRNNTPQIASPVTGTPPPRHSKVWESHRDWVKCEAELRSGSWLHWFGICLVSSLMDYYAWLASHELNIINASVLKRILTKIYGK
ncbi:hypothetical protein CDAR_396671 [Caerostris darwini]|uniref:Uncharacterized protein n=1 Tax=Caerostris darwini TaxID=1538125 RepID=A0AAV4PM36_9ARAC|nr:hypothetical protein CDAR_396671 [Caerostris darwini]